VWLLWRIVGGRDGWFSVRMTLVLANERPKTLLGQNPYLPHLFARQLEAAVIRCQHFVNLTPLQISATAGGGYCGTVAMEQTGWFVKATD